MDCRRIVLSKHVLRRMQERQIPPSAVVDVVENGELIEERDDEGQKVYLLLGFPSGRALHVVVIRRSESGECYVRTAYEPHPNEWGARFRRRK
jgi:hypothetical protein